KITVPVLVMHSEDDQIVPYVAAGPLSAKLLKNGTLKTYKDFPHGMPTTQAEIINTDLLAFVKAQAKSRAAAQEVASSAPLLARGETTIGRARWSAARPTTAQN